MNTHGKAEFLPLPGTHFPHAEVDLVGSAVGKTVIDGAVDLGDSTRTCDLGRALSLTVRQSETARWPADMLTARWHADWRSRHAGEYSDPKVAVHRLSTGAGGVAELEVTRTDWGQVQGAQAGFLALHGESPGRIRFLSRLLSGSPAPVPNIAAVHGVIETADGMILLNQRGPQVNYHPLTWSCSFEEGMEPGDLDAGSHALERTAARGMAEEFGVQADLDRMTVLGLLGDTTAMSVAAVVYCRIPAPGDGTYGRLKSAQAPDAWEHTRHLLVPASPEAMARLLLGVAPPGDSTSPERSDAGQGHDSLSWHPTSRCRLLLTMLFRFGRRRTAAALARATTNAAHVRPPRPVD
ncbi:hypothetical protein ACFVU0_15610 [Streptomyces sp. NPDC058122]|uniref:hypothetical protein n=1 Tax=Streptomyces sp. NPDC058122 TaxID=3346349 RepID=UPI0036DFC341